MKQILLFFCALFFSSSVQAGELQKITFCRANNMYSALVHIADHQGYFHEEGLDVSFLTATNGKLCIDSLIAGKADALTSGAGPLSYIGFSDAPLRIVAQMGVNSETSLIVRNDRGIATESNLKGKRIAYLPGTVSYLYLARILEKNNLSFSDLHMVALQAPAMPEALRGGLIDGFVMWEPWGENAIQTMGGQAHRLRDENIYNDRMLFAVSKALIDQHPEAVRGLLRALIKAESYVTNHPQEAINFWADSFKLGHGFLEKNWTKYALKVKLDKGILDLMNENARFIQRDDQNFKDKPMPVYRPLIEPSFLRDIAPERVGSGF